MGGKEPRILIFVKSQYLNKLNSLKPADLEMVEALYVLLFVFYRRQLMSSNAILGPSSG